MSGQPPAEKPEGWWYGLHPLASAALTALGLFAFLIVFDLLVLREPLEDVWMSAGTAALVIGAFQGLRSAGRERREAMLAQRKDRRRS